MPLTIVRGGKSPEDPYAGVRAASRCSSTDLRGSYPPYFIYGPLVFERATLEGLQLVRAHGQAVLGSPLVARLGERRTRTSRSWW